MNPAPLCASSSLAAALLRTKRLPSPSLSASNSPFCANPNRQCPIPACARSQCQPSPTRLPLALTVFGRFHHTWRPRITAVAGMQTRRHMSFNMFDLLPDLESLKSRRTKKLEDAVGKGKVKHGFVSPLEHTTQPLKGYRHGWRKHSRDSSTASLESSRTGDDTTQSQSQPLLQEVYRYQRSAQLADQQPYGSDDGKMNRARMEQMMPDLRLRCTELDIHGNVTVRAGEFLKSELCAQHGLQPRDLRKIDSKFVNQMPAILVRKHAILINLLHIRALIEADRIVLFDSIGPQGSYNQGLLVYELQERLRSPSASKSASASDAAVAAESAQPFEFRALEAVLISVVNALQSDEEVLVNLVHSLLAYLEESVDRSKLRELLQYSKRLSRFSQKVLNIRDAIEEVLEQDEDLASMYLTEKLRGTMRRKDDHEDVELMMETYLKQVEEIVNHIESASSHVRTTEDVVNIILDSQRNSLLLLEIRLTILTVGLSTGTFITGLFGMNLLSTLESHPEAFFIVSSIAFAAIVTLVLTGLRAMRKVLRKIN
ncbi:magnesium ion transporter [Coemansia sp. RSA 1939]|nr:magnesium ion transporter [Coemansia sp. RSA 1939]KAJ2602746.1 magnesium ion transporter [Coemansia sp. RSA 1804]KAJ2692058.1 magnesium ion transporter [Coemansia sp. RSA 1285]